MKKNPKNLKNDRKFSRMTPEELGNLFQGNFRRNFELVSEKLSGIRQEILENNRNKNLVGISR